MHKYRYAMTLAWHGMRRHPRSSVMVVAVMALGLAACMSVLTVFHVLSADPLPSRAGSLQTILFTPASRKPDTGDALLRVDLARGLVSQARGMAVAAIVPGLATVKNDATETTAAHDTRVLAATADIGKVFDIRLHGGRWWTAAEGRNHTPVAVISRALAERLFGTGKVVGRSIRMDDKSLRVIGVRGSWQPTLRFYSPGASVYTNHPAQVLIPLTVAGDVGLGLQEMYCAQNDFSADPWKSCSIATVWAYGAAGAEHGRLLAMAQAVAPRIPRPKAGNDEPYKPQWVSISDWLLMLHVVPDSVRGYVWVALAFLALCLLNAAGVLAARFLRRGPELGIRRALGASRRDVFAQHFLESGALAVVGGVLALPLVLGVLALLRVQAVRYADLIHFSVGTFLALCLATVLTGIAVGAYPAWRAAVVPPALQVKQN